MSQLAGRIAAGAALPTVFNAFVGYGLGVKKTKGDKLNWFDKETQPKNIGHKLAEGLTWGVGDAGLITVLDKKRTVSSGAVTGATVGAVTGALKGMTKQLLEYNDRNAPFIPTEWQAAETKTKLTNLAFATLVGAASGSAVGAASGAVMNAVNPAKNGKSGYAKRHRRRGARKARRGRGRKARK